MLTRFIPFLTLIIVVLAGAGRAAPPPHLKAPPAVPVRKPAVAKSAAAPPAAPTAAVATRLAIATNSARTATSWWESAAVEVVAAGRGRINYEANVVKAIGLGALPPPSLSRSRAQDLLDARNAALADALRTLGITVSRVRVHADTRVANYVVQSDEIRLRVDAFVRGADIIEEKLLPQSGVFRVVIQAPLTGSGSLSEAVRVPPNAVPLLQAAAPPDDQKQKPSAPSTPGPGSPAPAGARYTGLIVDCRGLAIRPCMSPKLYDARGREVYGTMQVAPEYVIETGIVGYLRSMNNALRAARVGERALVVRARGVADRNRFCPTLSREDADRVREMNRDGLFLERTAVVFVVDGDD